MSTLRPWSPMFMAIRENKLFIICKQHSLKIDLFSCRTRSGSTQKWSHWIHSWNSRISKNSIDIVKRNLWHNKTQWCHMFVENTWKPNFSGWLKDLSLCFPDPNSSSSHNLRVQEKTLISNLQCKRGNWVFRKFYQDMTFYRCIGLVCQTQ